MDMIELKCYENMKKVYICHPYRSDPIRNVKRVAKIVNKIGLANAKIMPRTPADLNKVQYHPPSWGRVTVPVSPMLAFPPGMSEGPDSNITEEQGMSFCLSLLFGCDELWVYAKEPTDGMIIEIEAASRWSIPVVWKV